MKMHLLFVGLLACLSHFYIFSTGETAAAQLFPTKESENRFHTPTQPEPEMAPDQKIRADYTLFNTDYGVRMPEGN